MGVHGFNMSKPWVHPCNHEDLGRECLLECAPSCENAPVCKHLEDMISHNMELLAAKSFVFDMFCPLQDSVLDMILVI